MQAALESLPTINPGDVTVTGAAGGPFVVTFGGRYVGQNVPTIVIGGSATGGSVTVAVTTAGGSAKSDGTETLDGFLYTAQTVNAGSTNIAAALLTHGKVRVVNLPTGNGLDAKGRNDVAGRIRFI